MMGGKRRGFLLGVLKPLHYTVFSARLRISASAPSSDAVSSTLPKLVGRLGPHPPKVLASLPMIGVTRGLLDAISTYCDTMSISELGAYILGRGHG